MSLSVRPQREDFFPRLRRGHGSTHRDARFDREKNIQTREANPCVEATCILNAPKSKNLHEDARANLKDWYDERRLTIRDKEHRHAQFGNPVEALYSATGGTAVR